MKLNESNPKPSPDKYAGSFTELIKHALLTYGLGKMAGPVKTIEKWLLSVPNESVTISSYESDPANRVTSLFSECNIKSKVVRSIDKLSEVPRYFITIPPLCDRLEDLPLITELIMTERLRIYPHDLPGIHPTTLPLFYYLCHNYDSPNGLKTPLLTEDDFVGFLRSVIDQRLIDKTVLDRIEFSFQVEDYEETKSCLRPLLLLEDKYIDLPSNSTIGNYSRIIDENYYSEAFGIPSKIAGYSNWRESAHVRSIASEEFSRFLKSSKISTKDQDTQVLLSLDCLQMKMVEVGRKCILEFENLDIHTVPEIATKLLNSSGLLAQSVEDRGLDRKTIGVMKLFDSDSSVVFDGKKYTLRTGPHYDAVRIIAQQMLAGNPAVGKEFIYESCRIEKVSIRDASVAKWFRKSGGDPKRFVEDGLLLSDGKGNCSLNVDKELIQIDPYDTIFQFDNN